MKLTDKQIKELKDITSKGYEVGLYVWQEHYASLNTEFLDSSEPDLDPELDLEYPMNWNDEEIIQQNNKTIRYALYDPNETIINENLSANELFKLIEKLLSTNQD